MDSRGDYAHRTLDVTSGAESFKELLLPPWVLRALHAEGYTKPSPVQTTAIPIGRLGTDLIVQAKAGTGKTLVFGVICLDKISPELGMPQALILAPTREIALQSADVLSRLAAHMPPPGISIGTFIGGLPIVEDQKLLRRRCHVTVGTPGRIAKLVELGSLVLQRCMTVVLDEADHLMSDSFVDIVRWLLESAAQRKQVLALSATYSPDTLEAVEALLVQPARVMLCQATTALLGVRQFYQEISPCDDNADDDSDSTGVAKIHALLRLVSCTSFNQAVVFTNESQTAQQAASSLSSAGYPAECLSAARPQVERMDSVGAVRSFKFRIVVATDLAARGLDLPAVNLVINLDLPYDGATYAHRVGRSGRYGTNGVAVTFVSPTEVSSLLDMVQEVEGGQLEVMPDVIPEELLYHQSSSRAGWSWDKTARDLNSDEAQSVTLRPSQGQSDRDTTPSATHSNLAVIKTHKFSGSPNAPAAYASIAMHAPTLSPIWQRGCDDEGSSGASACSSYEDYSHSSDVSAISSSRAASADASAVVLPPYVREAHGEAGSAGSGPKSTLYGFSPPHDETAVNARNVSSVLGGIMGASLWSNGPDSQQAMLPMDSDSNALPDAMRLLRSESGASEPGHWSVCDGGEDHAKRGGETAAFHPQRSVCGGSEDHARRGGETVADDGIYDASEQAPYVPLGYHAEAANETVVVSKQLLLRYYQLENFAAEYFDWFLRQTQPDEQVSLAAGSSEPEVVL